MRLKIREWLDERRETRNLEKALAYLPAPDVPEDVGVAWTQTPQFQRHKGLRVVSYMHRLSVAYKRRVGDCFLYEFGKRKIKATQ